MGMLPQLKNGLYSSFHRYVQSGLLDENRGSDGCERGVWRVVKVNLGYGLHPPPKLLWLSLVQEKVV